MSRPAMSSGSDPHDRNTGGPSRPATTPVPPPLPGRRRPASATGEQTGLTQTEATASALQRATATELTALPRTGDPFEEPPEPRPPRSAAPEDRMEFLRILLRHKTETLQRARNVYAEQEAAVHGLRTAHAAGMRSP